MKHTHASLPLVSGAGSGPDWQLLGELDLAVIPQADRTVVHWLTPIFSLLDLQADFRNRIMNSAREAVVHAMRPGTLTEFKHIRLLVFAPAQRDSKRQAWGFFQIEKIGNSANERDSKDHSIEFYLYPEG